MSSFALQLLSQHVSSLNTTHIYNVYLEDLTLFHSPTTYALQYSMMAMTTAIALLQCILLRYIGFMIETIETPGKTHLQSALSQKFLRGLS